MADRTIDDLRLLKWQPRYHGAIQNPTAPGGIVDMWALTDPESGDVLVTVGVPKGRSDIAGYIAACCGNPTRWVTDTRDLRDDGINDPEGVMERDARALTDKLFAVLPTGPSVNAWTLNDALSYLWFCFCGQLPHKLRGQLLYRFLQMATRDYPRFPSESPR